ncbi:MAG TPA: NAD(P)/FAD-dependent oxidoreductase [Bryobacteraceae bacterium]|nr:NAD(P)/FAD-dependent oxidoreductase [Bryobacteraceae bacterium]
MPRSPLPSPRVLIIGAGPAGLTAAYELGKKGVSATILEKDPVVGGLARTGTYRGNSYDIGGHRFFTKLAVVERMWREVLGDDLLMCQRLSRVYYNSHFFRYPIDPWDALSGLGFFEAMRCVASYLRAAVWKKNPEPDLETWICNRFGRRLFEIFFKTYTEKVWGMRCSEIQAAWAAQRIRGLSLSSLLKNALRRARNSRGGETPKTLIEQFAYPRLGPGMMWTRTRELVEEQGSRILLSCPVERIHWRPGAVCAVEGRGETFPADEFISTMPIRELIGKLEPAAPVEVARAANRLRYRDFLTAVLILKGKSPFPDNWIYIHDPEVKAGRIQNYGNWSPDMVAGEDTTCLGMEYFCFEDGDLWNAPDAEILKLAEREVKQLGLAGRCEVFDGVVVRMPKAYPIYDDGYLESLRVIREFLESIPNLQLVGRNGMHRYNNQDHSMLTGMLAARNILGARYDLWEISSNEDYLEDGFALTEEELEEFAASQPLVPAACVPIATSAERRVRV